MTKVVRWRSEGNRHHFFLGFSAVHIEYWRALADWPPAKRDYFTGIQRSIPAGWHLAEIDGLNPVQPAPASSLTGHTKSVVLPMWLLCLFAAAPTALLFYRDRRHVPPGHCKQCGYNLTGNVSGICPECGEKLREKH